MKHIVGLVVMALLVLSLYLFPTVGVWAIGAGGSLLVLASAMALVQTPGQFLATVARALKSDTLTGAANYAKQFVRALLLATLMVMVFTMPPVFGLAYAKVTILAVYLSASLVRARISEYRNALMRTSFVLKM